MEPFHVTSSRGRMSEHVGAKEYADLRAAELAARRRFRRDGGAHIYQGKQFIGAINADCDGKLWLDLSWYGSTIC